MSKQDVGVVLDTLAAVGEPVELAFHWRPMSPDPEDDMVLETALNGRAELLVTFNRRHFARAARRFRLKVGSPGGALRRLEANDETK